MNRHAIFLIALALLNCGAGTAQAKPRFEIEATRTLSWEHRQLKVELNVEGKARVETAHWNPCGGVPPGMSIVPGSTFGPWGDPNQLVVVDSAGKFVRLCDRAPEVSGDPYLWLGDVAALPTNLHLSLGSKWVGCKRYPEEGDSVGLRISDQRTPATPGTPAIQEVSFSASEEMSAYAWNELRSFCLVESEGVSGPNRECAEYFAPDLCATEYGTVEETLQMFNVRLIKTRTTACPKARAQKRRTERELRRLRRAGGRPYAMLLSRYRSRVLPRYKGECL